MNSTDQRIDQLLHILGNSTVPAGLEQRVHARLAQYIASGERNRSIFKRIGGSLWRPSPMNLVIWLSVSAAAVIAVGVGSLFHFKQIQPQPVTQASAPVQPAQLPSVSRLSPAPITGKGRTVVTLPQTIASGPQSSTFVENDPDAIALVETFAPSHAAPPMPLSAQETAISQSIRRGAPIEVAMFDARSELVAVTLASARERASVREYIHGLLGPLATAQALTSSSPRPDDTPTVADPEPPSSK